MSDCVAQAQLANELQKHGIEQGRLPGPCLQEFVAKAQSVAELTQGRHESASEALSDHLYGMAALIAQVLKGEMQGENFAREILLRHGIDIPAKTEPAATSSEI